MSGSKERKEKGRPGPVYKIESEVSPFPALTPGERLFFEVNGYVVIENTLSEDEVERIREALHELKRRFLAAEPEHRINGCSMDRRGSHYHGFVHLLEADPAFFNYLTHPRLVGLVEEAVGGKVRLSSSSAIINRRDPDHDPEEPFRFGFHRGGQPGFDSYVYDGLYHCTNVITLTNLTDLGPENGGTTAIAGSHKLNCNEEDMVAAAYEKPSLIHQVEAPPGSTMLMCETLIHATGQNRSDRERMMIIGGYSHPKHQAQGGREPSPQLMENLPDGLRELVGGHPFWAWPERHRSLGTPAYQKEVPYAARMWSVSR